MAVRARRIQSVGAVQSPALGIAMFAPSVLFIVLLIGVPFVLAILYAFSDARIGTPIAVRKPSLTDRVRVPIVLTSARVFPGGTNLPM